MMVKNLIQRYREGGIKAAVLGAGALFVTLAAEAYRAGNVPEAIGLTMAGVAAYMIHEALTQYQFEFTEDARDRVANALPGVEVRDEEPPDDQQ